MISKKICTLYNKTNRNGEHYIGCNINNKIKAIMNMVSSNGRFVKLGVFTDSKGMFELIAFIDDNEQVDESWF